MVFSSEVRVQRRRDVYIHGDAFGKKKSGQWDGEKKKRNVLRAPGKK